MMALAGCGQGEKPELAKPAAAFDLNKAKDGIAHRGKPLTAVIRRGRLVVIKDHKIVAADFRVFFSDGKVKDDTYGMTDGGLRRTQV